MKFNRSGVLFAATASLLLIAAGCAKKPKEDPVLARVGDRTITKKQYQYRTELTIRPKYPGLKSDCTKVELLKNLVTEKLFAIEAGDDYPLLKRRAFLDHIRGIKEQTMREELYGEVATKKVKVDTSELKQRYRLAAREYEVQFYTIRNKETARKIQEQILLHPEKAGPIFDGLGPEGSPIPKHTVKWKDPENDWVHEALFRRPVPVDTVIGPIRVGSNEHLIMRVAGWTDHPVIGGEEVQMRWNEVKEKTVQRKARAEWDRYMGRLLGGKAIKFNPPVFRRMADMAWMMYSATSDSQVQEINRNFFNALKDSAAVDPYGNEEAFLKASFFEVAGKTWTVEQFKRELAAHPLVYRRKNIPKEAFRAEFKNAVTDFMRDQFLNREAYKRGLDKRDFVRSNAAEWQDALVASHFRDEILKRLAEKHGLSGQPTKLKPVYEAYVDSLWAANRNRITWDAEMLKTIPLSSIDFFAYKPGVPFPAATPPFPTLITKSR
ncbi:MAG: hypothetical protein QUS35_13200 [bacterium]|nr:hypothetical protein [bacterium]